MLALLERALLLGDDPEAAAGRGEAAQILAAMGAEGLIERLEAGARAATAAPQPERVSATTPSGG